jgi:Domain of unknown function (DUF3291)
MKAGMTEGYTWSGKFASVSERVRFPWPMTDLKHIAQINVARMRAPLESPVMAEFVANLAGLNALADRSPGFVWRLESEGGDATAIQARLLHLAEHGATSHAFWFGTRFAPSSDAKSTGIRD